jgi:hypothetical protein
MELSENVGKMVAACQDDVKQAAGEIAEKLLIQGGPAVDGPLVEMEDLTFVLSQRLGAEVLRRLLATQAEAEGVPSMRCQQCGEVCEGKPSRPRVLTTRVGEVVWREPVRYCRRCRRSFSPSVRETEA